MPFPTVKRVRYGKKPLKRVVCQLRFSPILRVDAEVPAPFQEHIKSGFPNLIDKSELTLDAPDGSQINLVSNMVRLAPSLMKNYEFVSEDGRWKVNLTRTFMALSTEDYDSWERFKESLTLPLTALRAVYAPEYFTRVGLRYFDVFDKAALGLDEVPWSELLSPNVLGSLGSAQLADDVMASESRADIRLDLDNGMVRLQTRFSSLQESMSKQFEIDSDFFAVGQIPRDEGESLLDSLHAKAHSLLRWCITDKLHEAMEPTPI
ncbi:MAG: TIGR04255 family protein [SAR202 cluster bacterium]|nr:TIGR04255 family protein [SAR202 cluster bacterium]